MPGLTDAQKYIGEELVQSTRTLLDQSNGGEDEVRALSKLDNASGGAYKLAKKIISQIEGNDEYNHVELSIGFLIVALECLRMSGGGIQVLPALLIKAIDNVDTHTKTGKRKIVDRITKWKSEPS